MRGVVLALLGIIVVASATSAGVRAEAPLAITPVPRLKEPYRAAVLPERVPPPAAVPMSWRSAGAFVWHSSHLDPIAFGAQLRRAGFGWIALHVADGATEQPIDPRWIPRFRAASGLPVGGWSVLREDPEGEARLASRLVASHGLDFYIANAEREYAYTNDGVWDAGRYGRSSRFVVAFRRAKPSLPAALSSYCRPDTQDVDWHAWRDGGFEFLPQAYVNDFGDAASPSMCADAASAFFPRDRIHPTVGSWHGTVGTVEPVRYARLLAQAATTGFSVYPAENGMDGTRWREYGRALPRIASLPSAGGRAGDGLDLDQDPVG